MTSPAIKPNDKDAKTLLEQPSETDAAATMLPSTTQFQSCGLFAWLKVFRFADLLMRQASNMDTLSLPQYIVTELQKIANTSGFEEYTFVQDAGSKHGDGFACIMVNVTITGQRKIDGAVRTDHLDLICKTMPDSEHRQVLAIPAFCREVQMYNDALPFFVKFQKEKGLTAENGFFEFPKCYYAIADVVQKHYVIIMDDLRPIGFSLWDKMQPIEYDNVCLLMTALGRYHALSFAVRDQRPEVFAKFYDYADVFFGIIEDIPLIRGVLNASIDLGIGLLAKRPEPLEYLQKLRSSYIAELKSVVGKDAIEPFGVLGHGDCWNNNMMFQSDESTVGKICLLDWQLSRLGSPALDLSYFFLTSTNKSIRDKHLDEFLQIYYTNLATTLRACGSDPNKLFTFENLKEQLKQYGKYGVIVAPMLLQILVSEPKNIKQMNDVVMGTDDFAHRMTTFDEESEVRYVERITDVINDARAYGWIE